MCNCGKKRSGYVQKTAQAIAVKKTSYVTSDTSPYFNFEYTGKTALTVLGSVTRKRYRFNNPGERLPVDTRDAAGMLAVPVLRRID